MRLEVRYDTGDTSIVVGNLLSAQHKIFFQYAAALRDLKVEHSPFKLPTEDTPY